ncbi:MAG: hypothetical protein OXD01_03365 [Gammaproteobacteria bacterium]|nr:hypothetical protein [Gammaproteobacteria bacterium]
MAQSQISHTLRSPVGRDRISALLAREEFSSRSALSRRVCEEFSFLDPLGRPQVASCMDALTSLAKRDPDISLPPSSAPAIKQHSAPVGGWGGVTARSSLPSVPNSEPGTGGGAHTRTAQPLEHAD